MTRSIPILTSVDDLAASADAWICDIWGVMHNGATAFRRAGEAALRFRKRGGIVLLLSNAPRPAASVAAQLATIGVMPEAYDGIVSSGDLTRRLVMQKPGGRVFHLGPPRDRPIFEGLDVELVEPEAAETFVCSGLLNDDTETAETYRPLLTAIARQGLTMICANPDITVERGDRLLYCAGALAELYETLGGQVVYAGKPHRPAYDLAFETINRLAGRHISHDRILAIGDGIRTDILGAHTVGLRSLFIASAVHVKVPLTAAVLSELFGKADARPIAAMSELA